MTAVNTRMQTKTPALRDWLIERPLARLLIERINSQSTEELGVEIGRLLGHDLAGESYVTDLRHAAGIQQESDIGSRSAAAAQQPQRPRRRSAAGKGRV